jgi:hypothetical protein
MADCGERQRQKRGKGERRRGQKKGGGVMMCYRLNGSPLPGTAKHQQRPSTTTQRTVAASPEAKATACLPCSTAAMARSKAPRVGLPVREYSNPFPKELALSRPCFTPGLACCVATEWVGVGGLGGQPGSASPGEGTCVLGTDGRTCAKVVAREMGGTTAPVAGSGSCPAWMAAVPKPPYFPHCGRPPLAAAMESCVCVGGGGFCMRLGC